MHKPIRPQTVQNFLHRNKKLQDLIQKAQQNSQLLILIRELCPEKIKSHLVSAQSENQMLILMTDSPAWASQLRFLSSQLLQKLKKQHYFFKKIIIKVSLQKVPVQNSSNTQSVKKLSKETSHIIQQTANMIGHPQLKKALMNLSRYY